MEKSQAEKKDQEYWCTMAFGKAPKGDNEPPPVKLEDKKFMVLLLLHSWGGLQDFGGLNDHSANGSTDRRVH